MLIYNLSIYTLSTHSIKTLYQYTSEHPTPTHNTHLMLSQIQSDVPPLPRPLLTLPSSLCMCLVPVPCACALCLCLLRYVGRHWAMHLVNGPWTLDIECLTDESYQLLYRGFQLLLEKTNNTRLLQHFFFFFFFFALPASTPAPDHSQAAVSATST